jgi:hypothetical protein
MPDDAELLRRNWVSDQQDQIPPRLLLPVISAKSRQAHNLAGPGPWQLTGRDNRTGHDVTTVHEGPVDQVAVALIHAAYPDVAVWDAAPAAIDETYTDSRKAAYRICQLLGTDLKTARAIQTIAADDVLGYRFAYGKWEITGDDDEQSFRIRTIVPGPGQVLVPVTREQGRRVVPVLRDWANAGDVTVACLGVADAIDHAMTGTDATGGTRQPAPHRGVKVADEPSD